MSKETFEEFLMEKHAEQYTGFKDTMVDDFSNWLVNADVDDLIEYGDKFAKKKSKELLEACEELSALIIKIHPHSVEFKEQLRSGELERRMNVIGVEKFDPTGRVRAMLKAEQAITKA